VNLDSRRKALEAANDDDALCIITVRADRSIRVWVSDRIQSGEQFAWLHGQIAAGSSKIVAMEDAYER
jgi:hypothetical protein